MTTKKKPKVYITRKLPDAVETRMRELFDAELNIDDTPRTQAELVEAVQSADVLVPTVTDRIDAALIEEAGPQHEADRQLFQRHRTTSTSKQPPAGASRLPTRRMF